MITDGIFAYRNVLYPTSGTAGFGKIQWLPFPKYIVLALLYLFNVGYKGFIIPDGDLPNKILVRLNV